jgi:hypothetical protein
MDRRELGGRFGRAMSSLAWWKYRHRTGVGSPDGG